MRVTGIVRDSQGQPYNGTARLAPASRARFVGGRVILADPIPIPITGGALDVTLEAGVYALVLSPPTQPLRLVIPDSTGTADISQVASNWGNLEPVRAGLPPGGSSGYALVKQSDADFDAGWSPVSGGGGGGGGIPEAPQDGNAYARRNAAWVNADTRFAAAAHSHSAGDITSGQLPIARGGTGAGDAAVARSNLGLGNSATRDVGTTAGTVAAGDDSRIVNAVPSSRQIAAGTGLAGGGDLSADRSLALTGQALALHNLAANGLIARTGAGAVAARTITAGANITVTNGDGVAGNPTVAVTGLAAIATSGSASDLAAGTVPAARLNLTADGNYVRRSGGALQERTPAQVLSDIGAAAASHSHAAEDITSGVFAPARLNLTTDNNYLRRSAGALQERTPAQVLSDIGAAAAAHTHPSTDITDWNEAVDDRVAALLQAGTGITLTYNDAANTLTIAATGGGGGVSENALIDRVVATFDGASSPLTAGLNTGLQLRAAGTIRAWTLLADVTGSVSVDVWKGTYAAYPLSSANSIVGTGMPAISNAQKATGGVSGWTATSVAAGEVLWFNIHANATNITRVVVILEILKNN